MMIVMSFITQAWAACRFVELGAQLWSLACTPGCTCMHTWQRHHGMLTRIAGRAHLSTCMPLQLMPGHSLPAPAMNKPTHHRVVL